MAFSVKAYNDIVTDVINRLKAADIGFSDNGGRTIIQTIIEAIAVELNITYEKLQYLYDSLLIDNAVDIELDRLVSIFNVIRKPATAVSGVVTFYRTSPATADIVIPVGTIVSTQPDLNGNTFEFITSADATILLGNTSTTANVICLYEGYISLLDDTVVVMNGSVIGVEGVTNDNPITGGTNVEDDIKLRERAREALSGLGKGTASALENVVKSISGIIDANLSDLARGVGTADLIVVGDSIPMSPALMDQVVEAVAATKAAGVDVGIVEPTVVSTPVTISVVLHPGYTIGDISEAIEAAIVQYINTLKVGMPCIINQMNKSILNANPGVADIVNTVPNANITVTSLQIVRVGVITING